MIDRSELDGHVHRVVQSTRVWDLHTHLYPPAFGSPTEVGGDSVDPQGLALWGIDELLTYHYLIAEVFRVVPASEFGYQDFWRMSKGEQADHIWKHLFIERSPLSEACRGVLTTLARLGLDPASRSLDQHRAWFREQKLDEHIDHVMRVAGVSRITMTNDVFDENERERWLKDSSLGRDPRFAPVLRFDPLLINWETARDELGSWGYQVEEGASEQTLGEVRRFLEDWIARIEPIYCAVSLPPTFRYEGPDDLSDCAELLRRSVLPTLADAGLPFAMMIGAVRGVNPDLRGAGDGLGNSDVSSVERLCRDFPANRFLCTMLSRENQHELAVAARKFGNLLPFGCWWFLNNPSLVDEITRLRTELLGLSYVPQHSDARILEQLIYKWDHSREVIAGVLVDKYVDLATTGWRVTEAEIERDVALLLHGEFERFLKA